MKYITTIRFEETLEEKIKRLIDMRRNTNDEKFEEEINEELSKCYDIKYGEEKQK